MTLHHLPKRVQHAFERPPKPLAERPAAPRPAAPPPPTLAYEWKAPSKVDDLMVFILKAQRTHDTQGERDFRGKLRQRLADAGHEITEHCFDQFSVTVPAPGGRKADTLFCCHIDTCDGRMSHGSLAAKTLTYDPSFGLIGLADDSQGDCLGADDGAGVWMLMKMIEARVPGAYLFHRGEECGGLGAKAMALEEADWLRQFNVAVEFDRAGYTDIITHQRGGVRCASDKFAEALSAKLQARGIPMRASDRGVYTDVYEYRGLIAECVNLSVGYHSQHGRQEDQDYGFACALLDAATRIDWSALPVDREPAVALAPVQNLWLAPQWGDSADEGDVLEALQSMTRAQLESWARDTPPDEVAEALETLLQEREEMQTRLQDIADLACGDI